MKEIKTKIFSKYNRILKEIVEVLKMSEIKNVLKVNVMAKNLYQEMRDISKLVDGVVREEDLLELGYAPASEEIEPGVAYRSDLTFFHKEQKMIQKYHLFWEYVHKIKHFLDNIHEKKVLGVDGVELMRLLR